MCMPQIIQNQKQTKSRILSCHNSQLRVKQLATASKWSLTVDHTNSLAIVTNSARHCELVQFWVVTNPKTTNFV
jgi:hypothetical protein